MAGGSLVTTLGPFPMPFPYVIHAMPLQPDKPGFKSPSLSNCATVGKLLSLLSLTFHVCKMGIINPHTSFGYAKLTEVTHIDAAQGLAHRKGSKEVA